MKRLLVILSIVSILLFSCAEKQPEPVVAEPVPLPFTISDTLLQIDTLLQSRPDSALLLLIDPLSFRAQRGISYTFNESYRNLLLSEALYKNGNPQYYRDNLQEAMRFFDSLAMQYPGNDDATFYSARSHYMNGVGYYETDSVVAACREYLHTLEIMENHFDVVKLTGYRAKFMGLTYGRLGELFSNKFMIDNAIDCFEKSLCYHKTDTLNKSYIANIEYHIGVQYDEKGISDSAYYYYNEALKHIADSNNVLYRDIMVHKILLSYGLGIGAESSILNLKQIIQQADNDDELLTRYVAIGYIYYKEALYDSAAYYLEKVYNNKNDQLSRHAPAEYLRSIYLCYGDTIKSNEYASFLADNNISKYDNMMEVSILDKLFNEYLELQEIKQHHNNKMTAIKIMIVVAILVVLLFTQLIYINRRNKKVANKKYEKEKEKSDKLKRQLFQKRSEIESRTEAFLNEPICRKICNSVCDIQASARSNYSDYTYLKLDDEAVMELSEAVNKHFPNFKTRLLSYDVEMKNGDFLLCYLYLLGLNNAQIALLRQCNFATVSRQITRLKKSFKDCDNLSEFIKKSALS